jgi:hypothetical protein
MDHCCPCYAQRAEYEGDLERVNRRSGDPCDKETPGVPVPMLVLVE